jgi:hypothetical protein
MLRGGGVQQVLVDNLTLHEEIVLVTSAAHACGAEVTLLWPTARATERQPLINAGVHRILVKPIKGLELVEAMYGDLRGGALETRAA